MSVSYCVSVSYDVSVSYHVHCTARGVKMAASYSPYAQVPHLVYVCACVCVCSWSCVCVLSQMVSLLHLAEITEEGVTFQSPVDGSMMLLTPEQSMAIQNRLGR